MNSNDNCIICLEKRIHYLPPEECIQKGSLPNFTTLCQYLQIKFTPQLLRQLNEVPWFVNDHKDKDKDNSCEKFLCLDCFDLVYNLSKLYEQAEEIQRKIGASTCEIRNVITRISVPGPEKGASRKRGRKPSNKLNFALLFQKLVKDAEGNRIGSGNGSEHIEKVTRTSKRVKHSNSSKQTATNENPVKSIILSEVDIKVESIQHDEIEDTHDFSMDENVDHDGLNSTEAEVHERDNIEANANTTSNTETLPDADEPGAVDIKTEVEIPPPKKKRKHIKNTPSKKLPKSKPSEAKGKLKKLQIRNLYRESQFNSLDIPTIYETKNDEHIQVRHCPICNHKCIGRRARLGVFIEHTLSHENELTSDPSKYESHKCSQCDQQFIHKLNLELHKISNHEVRLFHLKCEHCDDNSSKTGEDLITHLKSHSDTIHSCKSCPMSFTSLDSVLHHMIRHSRSKRLLCPECPYIAPTLKEIFKHCHSVHPDLKQNFKCDLCSKSFLTQRTLKSHIDLIHEENGKSHKCTLSNCEKVFETKKLLLLHIRDNHEESKPFKCDQCPKSFILKAHLQYHTRTIHEQVRYPCPHCAKSYSEQRALSNHLKLHTGEGLFTCQTCGKQCATKPELKIHSVVHLEKTPENACVCEICGKECPSDVHLRRHKLVHKDKQLECEYCGMKFNRADNLRGHLRTHTGERPFVCVVCSKGFNRKDIMIVHMKVHGMGQAEANQRYAEMNAN